MKKLLLLPLFALAMNSFAQKKNPLSLDSTARKHELQVNASYLTTPLATGNTIYPTAFDINYSRSYLGRHYLRIGMGAILSRGASQSYTTNNPLNSNDTSYVFEYQNGGETNIFYGKVGYEVSLGKRKTRFLFGSDMLIGYQTNYSFNNYKSITGNYLQFFSTDIQRGLSAGINPRFTVRYDFSRFFSGGVTLGFYAGGFFNFRNINRESRSFTPETIDYNETKSTPKSMSYFYFFYKPELNLIFKIPPKKSKAIKS